MSRTQIGILWGVGLLAVAGVVLLGHALARPSLSSAVPEPTPTPGRAYSLPDIPGSARNLYPLADQAARSWQADAQLASALANWPYVVLDELSEPTGWTFQFYSAGTGRVAVISVDGAQVTVLRSALSPYPLPTILAEGWTVDSPQALNAWLARGGGTLLERHSAVDVSARLRAAEGGRAEWAVAGVVRDRETMELVRVDALSGEVLE